MYPEHNFDANGVQINFAQASTSGPPVVLLHGVASEWESFLPLMPVLSERHQVYALDLRGHGKSGWTPGHYHLMDYARDVGVFLDVKLSQPAALYGHSLGALVSLAVAVQFPERVRALILGDPPFYYHDTTTRESVWSEAFVEMQHVLTTRGSAGAIEAYMAEHYPNMQAQRRAARAETLSHVDPDAVAAILEDALMAGVDTDRLLRQVACPVLLLQGDAHLGSALRENDAAYLLARLERCELVRMSDVGHGLPGREALSKVERFLEERTHGNPKASK